MFVSIVRQGGFMYLKREQYGEDLCYEWEHVEKVCYEEKHIQAVVEEINENFKTYFEKFLNQNPSLKESVKTAIDEFECDRDDYVNIFNLELLKEYEDDLETFKLKVLKNECPIIRKTLNSRKSKALDKYRTDFSKADAKYLNDIVYNLCLFGETYAEQYDPNTYDSIADYKELGMEALDTDEYTAYKVIGGGIKTHMLFKVHPGLFSNKSRLAVWALWYLSGKKTFGCLTDSEFLMIHIDKEKVITQQNYYYPYRLFHYYAFEIYKLLKEKAESLDAYIDPNYRYVLVDAFLQFIADTHKNEIAVLEGASDREVYYYV